MNTKYIAYFILVFTIMMSVVSCNEDSTDTLVEGPLSKNALIQSFSVKGTPKNALDSITYPILEKTKFAIDHQNGIIYNPDSLAYGTVLATFKPAITLAETTSSIDVDNGDTIYTWDSNEADSIDFSKNIVFKVVPQAGAIYTKKYTLKFNIRQYDPDTLNWERVKPLPVAANIPLKAIALDDNVVVFAVVGSKINAYMSPLDNVAWTATATTLPTSIRLSSITVFKDNIYAVDKSGGSYKASTADPLKWEKADNGLNVHNILGVLPAKVETDDVLLVAINDNGQYRFGKSKDLSSITLIDKIEGYADALIPVDEYFPSVDFSSTTNYDRINLKENHLIISGGVDFKGKTRADAWFATVDKNNALQLSPLYYGASNKLFDVADDYKAFVYDDKLYAATNDTLYISQWGMNWIHAPQKQQFLPTIETAKNQSIVVDKNHFIWIVGSADQAGRVWKGRLNRMLEKK